EPNTTAHTPRHTHLLLITSLPARSLFLSLSPSLFLLLPLSLSFSLVLSRSLSLCSGDGGVLHQADGRRTAPVIQVTWKGPQAPLLSSLPHGASPGWVRLGRLCVYVCVYACVCVCVVWPGCVCLSQKSYIS